MALKAATALANESKTPELDRERDVLIEQIVSGEKPDAVKQFKALIQKRDLIVATSESAKARVAEAERIARTEEQRRDVVREAWTKRVESRLHYCVMAPDPKDAFIARRPYDPPLDWGKVIRKEKIRLLGKNELDEGKPATMYEVAGVRKHYFVHGEIMRDPFVAEVGDLVLLCAERAGYDKTRSDDAFELWRGDAPLYPPSWPQPVQRGGLAARIARVPLIAEKARFNPFHVSRNDMYWAISDVKLHWPADRSIVVDAEVQADLGGGRYEMLSESGKQYTWILEVPPSLPNKALLLPAHSVWLIANQAHFDKTLRKLVLVAQDLEEHYVIEK